MVIIRNPSKEILKSVVHPEEIKKFNPHEKILDVATALSTTNPSVTLEITRKYGAKYIFVYQDEKIKIYKTD